MALAVLASAITIWMGYKTEMGFKNGNQYYDTPSTAIIILSLIDFAILLLTLGLFLKASRLNKLIN